MNKSRQFNERILELLIVTKAHKNQDNLPRTKEEFFEKIKGKQS